MYISDISVVTSLMENNKGCLQFKTLVIIPSNYRNEIVKVEYELYDKNSEIVATTAGAELYNGELNISNVNLWWPVGMSDTPAYLYNLKVSKHSVGRLPLFSLFLMFSSGITIVFSIRYICSWYGNLEVPKMIHERSSSPNLKKTISEPQTGVESMVFTILSMTASGITVFLY